MKHQNYDFIFISQVPVFYKVNLYNSLSKKYKVFVIFLANSTLERRSNDFLSKDKIRFDYIILPNENLQRRNKIKTTILIYNIVGRLEYQKLVLCAWDYLETWLISWLFPKVRNSFILESSIIESNLRGYKKNLKQFFLSRINTVYASGELHVDLLCALGYRGEIIKTRGVGLINKYKSAQTKNVKDIETGYFLFIGRLIKEKNIGLLVDYFSAHTDHKLKIIGEGPLNDKLKRAATANIEFLGSVSNESISIYLDNAIALVLPSTSEPWGLVVEEALFNACHVLISRNCGVVELLKDNHPEQMFNPNSIEDFALVVKAFLKVYDENKSMECGPKIIEKKDLEQINSYNLNLCNNVK